ncbi:hypothetical protein QTJ16_000875 [Diplocarpon rosae]|uniref:GTP 3',8-cyclase n=1 Tax=Diplocarpon rosae TaxID=946125 RepID=A0AAD9T644_9HELO|nr:hypothetical protein QTJ16_000875 [Diplocarpon rosae]
MTTSLLRSGNPTRHSRTLIRASRRGLISTVSVIQESHRHDLSPVQPRRAALKNAPPFSAFLTDTFRRQHDYLRISITEKCNLRCLYCMPEEGVPQSPPPNLLTTPEIYLLSSTFVTQGVTKIRLTGGEPTVRRDILPLMHQIGSLRSRGLKELCVTTNGISLHRKLDSMAEAGLTGVNLSLDTLDPWQFQIMTRRKGFEAVMKSINRILEMNKLGAGIKLKINCVVMRGMNEREIIPFVELGREQEIEVRFIEYMPFDGNKWSQGKMLSYQEMLGVIRAKYPTLRKVQDHENDTSKTYEIPGFVGKIGFITSMTHNFCGSCNRLRITSDGNLKVCLFGNAEVSLRDIIRKTNQGNPIDEAAFEAMKQVEMSRRQRLSGSPGPLGGTEHEHELLEVIGLAVKGKKEKHAGMGELENMKNRPMILIGGAIPLIKSNSMKKGDVLSVARIAGIMAAKKTSDLVPLCHPIVITFAGVELELVGGEAEPHTVRSEQSAAGRPEQEGGVKMPKQNKGQGSTSVSWQGTGQGDAYPFHTPPPTTSSSPLPPSATPCPPLSSQFGHISIRATVECDGKTGVEMEALTAASVAALTVYDMCKAVDKGMAIAGLRVVRKEGGSTGIWVEGKGGSG